MAPSPLKPRPKITRKMITQRIVDTGGQLILTSQEDMLAAFQCDTMAPDIMERFLRTVKGDLDPDVATSSLLSILLMRAIEKVEMDCVECEEDNRYIIEDRYTQRYESYIYLLQGMIHNGPLRIADDSKPAITGQSMTQAKLGSKYPIIIAGWERIRDAISRFNSAH